MFGCVAQGGVLRFFGACPRPIPVPFIGINRGLASAPSASAAGRDRASRSTESEESLDSGKMRGRKKDNRSHYVIESK
jgi:hypothetical protein